MKKETAKTAAKKKIAAEKTPKTAKKPSTPPKTVPKTAKTSSKSQNTVKKTLVKKAAAPKKAVTLKETPLKPKMTKVIPVPVQPDASRQPQTQLSHRRPLLIIPK